MIEYHISPTLLDKFQAWQESESSWEEYYGSSEEPSVTLDEWDIRLENDLIAAVNGDKMPPSEAADLGTCLNEIVDCIVLGEGKTRDDVEISLEGGDGIKARKGENEYLFHKEDMRNLASWLKGYVPQEYASAEIETYYGKVQLYGYPDYYSREEGVVIDLKSTKRYEAGKFRYKWQRYIYPYILTKSGKMDMYMMFRFMVCKVSGGNTRNPWVELEMVNEDYTDPIMGMEDAIRGTVEQFIRWYRMAMEKGLCTDRLVGERR